jgi:hypothetical protein
MPPGEILPVSVETEGQMQAAGNSGPPSSILLPTSCQLTGAIVTATGTYQGGPVPNVYNRYGDIVELYVFAASSPGFPQGAQLGASSAEDSPPLGSSTWRVSTTVAQDPGSHPARCVVAAQPTHDEQLAP